MLRKLISFIIFGGVFSPIMSVHAAGCYIDGSSSSYTELNIPIMSIPADTPDGTILYTSPKKTLALNCTGVSGSSVGFVNVATTADFNQYTAQRYGVRTTVYIDGKPFSSPQDVVIGTSSASSFQKSVPIWIELKVDKSLGSIPKQGTVLNGGFESLYILQNGSYTAPRVVIILRTPNITFIPCSMELSVSPEAIDFSTVRVDELDKGKKFQRAFSTTIKKNKSCLTTGSTAFGMSMYFEPTASSLNADGSLNLNNGLGLSISDSLGKNIPYNTAWKIDNVKVESVLRNQFTANLQKISGQDVKTGPFSTDVVVRIDYY